MPDSHENSGSRYAQRYDISGNYPREVKTAYTRLLTLTDLSPTELGILSKALNQKGVNTQEILNGSIYEVVVDDKSLITLTIEGAVSAVKSGDSNQEVETQKGSDTSLKDDGKSLRQYQLRPTKSTRFAAGVKAPTTRFIIIEVASNRIIPLEKGQLFDGSVAHSAQTDDVITIQTNAVTPVLAVAQDRERMDYITAIREKGKAVRISIWVPHGQAVITTSRENLS